MKFSAKHNIEPLEARIAPARVIEAGVPNDLPALVQDVDYTDTFSPFKNPDGTIGNDDVQAALEDAIFLDTEAQILLGDTKIAGKVGGPRQLKGIRTGLSHNVGATGGSVAVTLLQGEN